MWKGAFGFTPLGGFAKLCFVSLLSALGRSWSIHDIFTVFFMWVPRMMGRVDRVSTEGRLRSVYSDDGWRSFEEKIKK